MATKKKPSNKKPTGNVILDAIVEEVSSLYQEHAKAIDAFKSESETEKITVNFAVVLDYSETEPTVKTSIRFSQSVTDTRIAKLDDPNQPPLIMTDIEFKEAAEKAAEKDEKPGVVAGEGV